MPRGAVIGAGSLLTRPFGAVLKDPTSLGSTGCTEECSLPSVSRSKVAALGCCCHCWPWRARRPPALVTLSDQRGLVFFLPALRRLKLFIVKINN